MASPILTRRRAVAVVLETTPGTAAPPPATLEALEIIEASVEPDVALVERSVPASLTAAPSAIGTTAARVRFATYVADTPAIDAIFAACGCALVGGAWVPSSIVPAGGAKATKTASVYVWQGGRRQTIRGAMGSFRLVGEAGEPLRLEVDFVGIYDGVTLSPLPTQGVPTAPLAMAKGACLGTAVLARFTFDAGADARLREDCCSTTGLAYAVIAARAPTFAASVEMLETTTPESALLAGTVAPIAIDVPFVGAAGGVEIAAPAAQVQRAASSDRNGIAMEDVEYVLTGTTGDDEYTLTITPPA